MKEIKLTIDGKEVPLTEKQWSFLRTIEKEKHPFERAYYGGNYFCISSLGSIESYSDCQDSEAEAFFKEVNYEKKTFLDNACRSCCFGIM